MYEGTIVSDDGLSQELAYELKHLSSGPPPTFLNVFPASDGQYSNRSELATASSPRYQPSTSNPVRADSSQPDYSLLSVETGRKRSASTVSALSATSESFARKNLRPKSYASRSKVTKADKRNKVAQPRRKQLSPIAKPIPRLTFEALAEWAWEYRGCLVASSIDDHTLNRNLNDPSERQKWGPEQLSSFKEHLQRSKGGPTICSICFVADGEFLPKRQKVKDEACRCVALSKEDKQKYASIPGKFWRPDHPSIRS
jgi:hypothetical protein